MCRACLERWHAARLRDVEGLRAAIEHARELVEYWTCIAVLAERGSLEEWQASDLAAEWEARVGRLQAELAALKRED